MSNAAESRSTSAPRVLFSQRRLIDPTNPFSNLLLTSLSSCANPIAFTWKTAIIGKYDIVHLQWPEYVFREKRLSLRLLNLLLCYIWIFRLLTSRIPVVETIHNLRPHDQSAFLERAALNALRTRVKHRIYLNRSCENDLSKGSVILHGHYRNVIQELNLKPVPSQSRYFLFFGLVRPYKGMENLIEAYRGYYGPVEKLIIAGLPVNREYGELVESLASPDERIHLDFRHIPDKELAELVSNATGVVLPYDYMYNSGALIYSLSANTRVLAPASPANSTISDEVGPGWLLTFDETVRPHDLHKLAEENAGSIATGAPNLSERDWDEVGTQHMELYRSLLQK